MTGNQAGGLVSSEDCLEVLGIHTLALWMLAKEMHPDDPADLAVRVLREAQKAYYEIPIEDLEAICSKLIPQD